MIKEVIGLREKGNPEKTRAALQQYSAQASTLMGGITAVNQQTRDRLQTIKDRFAVIDSTDIADDIFTKIQMTLEVFQAAQGHVPICERAR